MNERCSNCSRTYVTVCEIRKHFIFEEPDNEVVGIIKRFSGNLRRSITTLMRTRFIKPEVLRSSKRIDQRVGILMDRQVSY